MALGKKMPSSFAPIPYMPYFRNDFRDINRAISYGEDKL